MEVSGHNEGGIMKIHINLQGYHRKGPVTSFDFFPFGISYIGLADTKFLYISINGQLHIICRNSQLDTQYLSCRGGEHITDCARCPDGAVLCDR